MPFRSAYKITGEIVAYCIQNGKSLNALTIEEYKGFTELFEGDIYAAIDLKTCVMSRKSEGGPAPESVMAQIAKMQGQLYQNTKLRIPIIKIRGHKMTKRERTC